MKFETREDFIAYAAVQFRAAQISRVRDYDLEDPKEWPNKTAIKQAEELANALWHHDVQPWPKGLRQWMVGVLRLR